MPVGTAADVFEKVIMAIKEVGPLLAPVDGGQCPNASPFWGRRGLLDGPYLCWNCVLYKHRRASRGSGESILTVK